MSDATVRANAQTMPIDRRALFGSLAAAGALLAVRRLARAAAPPDGSQTLAALIAAHTTAREAFCLAVDELEAAEPADDARVVGLSGCDYPLSNGKERIAEWFVAHFERLADSARAVAIAVASRSTGAETVAVLERERDAALARLEEAFAVEDTARRRWNEKKRRRGAGAAGRMRASLRLDGRIHGEVPISAQISLRIQGGTMRCDFRVDHSRRLRLTPPGNELAASEFPADGTPRDLPRHPGGAFRCGCRALNLSAFGFL
jgi:hypothetical protein